MKIKKRYDIYVIAMYTLIIAMCLFMIIYPLATMKKVKITWLDIIFMIVSILFLAFLVYSYVSISYSFDEKHLNIKSSFNTDVLKYKDIMGIKTCRKFFSWTITSIKCVEIAYSPYGKKKECKYYYVSPKNRDEFIEELKEKCKRLA